MSFARGVWRLVRRIPRGRVATYGQIAALLGRPRAARVVGRAMHDCPDDVPWHRVVNASGGISRRAQMDSMLTQRLLLVREGIALRNGHVKLTRYRWETRTRIVPEHFEGLHGKAAAPGASFGRRST